MVCLGLEPRVTEWKPHTNPLSYGGTPTYLGSVTYTAIFVYRTDEDPVQERCTKLITQFLRKRIKPRLAD